MERHLNPRNPPEGVDPRLPVDERKLRGGNLLSEKEKASSNPMDRMKNMVKELEILRPAQMVARLREFGYCGQEQACRSLSLFAYRHLRRLKAAFVDGEAFDQIPHKDNLWMTGPTGVGKTYLMVLLFGEVLHLPVINVDVSRLTESGFVGQSVDVIPKMLIHATRGNWEKASVGIVCLDEFDKLAGNREPRRDVGGYQVQQELLKMIEGSISPLDAKVMNQILERQVLSPFQKECEREGWQFKISPATRKHLVSQSLRHPLGARGLNQQLQIHLQQASYEAFSQENSGGCIRIGFRDGKPVYRVES